MNAEYALAYRERVLSAIDAGLSLSGAAELFAVSPSAIKRWQQRRRETGSPARLPRPGRPRRIRLDEWPALREQLQAHPAATVSEHCALWESEQGVRVSRTAMWRALERVRRQ